MAMKLLIKTTVLSVREEAEGVRSFVLVPAKRPVLPPFPPGAHVIVQVPNGLRRVYSLCSDPADDTRWRIAVLREPAGLGGSACMHDNVREGTSLFVTYPDNHFPLDQEAGRHIFIAGGIGITPFLPMVIQARRMSAPFELHYCSRSASRAAFTGELEALCPPRTFFPHYDGGNPSEGLNIPQLLEKAETGTHVYACGPAGMLDAVRRASAQWPSTQVHYEAFSGLPIDQLSRGEPFRIRIASSGQLIEVGESKSARTALGEAGFAIDAVCERGVCGTCKVRYVAGEPVHRDSALMPTERASHFVTCVSRARGEIKLDL